MAYYLLKYITFVLMSTLNIFKTVSECPKRNKHTFYYFVTGSTGQKTKLNYSNAFEIQANKCRTYWMIRLNTED